MFGDGGIRIPLLLEAGGLCRHPLTGAERTSTLYSILRGTAVKTEAFFARCFPEATKQERTRAAEPLARRSPFSVNGTYGGQNGRTRTVRGRSGGLNPVFRKMGFFGFGWLWDKGNGRIQGAFRVRWKHFVSSWRWVSAKKLPLGVSLWGKSVYTSFCVEQGLTLKGLPSSRDATAFSPLAAASKKRRSSDTLSSRRRFEFQVPRTRNICASVCLGRQAGPLLLVLVQEPWSGLSTEASDWSSEAS